jgi:hypothetical protein
MSLQILCLALIAGQPAADPTAFINQHFAQHWREHMITPSAKCGDHEFLRRASLDLIGRIPAIAEIDAYMMDAPEQRHRLLIDRLLKHDDAPRHWANVWTEWLLGTAPPSPERDAFHDWLRQHFAANRSHKELAEKLMLATGSTRDNPAGLWLVARRGLSIPDKNWEREGKYDMAPATNEALRVFHGRRLQCVQCHDHPHESELGQHHFYGINCFFRQVDFKRSPNGSAEIQDNPSLNTNGLVPYDRRKGARLYTDLTFLDGTKVRRNVKGTRREFLTEHLVKHRDFARAASNRLWGYFLGHGLCQTPDADDFGSHNPVIHEKVLDRLAEEFFKSGHDPKTVIRAICLNDCYSLSSVANRTNAGPEQAVAFARMQVKRLSNAQIVESVLTSVQAPLDAEARTKQRRAWLTQMYSPPLPAPSECDFEPSDPSVDLPSRELWLMNSKSLHDALQDAEGTVTAIARRHPKISEAALGALFLHALSRPPSPGEIDRLLRPQIYLPRVGLNPNAEGFWRRYYEDVFWSLLNSNEFALNH